MSLYPQSPQTIGQVLDSGLNLYRHILKPMLPLSLAVAVLGQVPQLAPYLMAGTLQPGQAPGGMFMLALAIGVLAWFFVNLALYAGWIKSMDSLARGQPALGLGAAFSFGGGKAGRILGASVLFGLAFMAGLLLLVIPGVILMTSLFFYGYLIVLEDRPAVASLRESHRLVWGNWWRTVTVMTVGGLIYFVGLFVVGGIAGVVMGIGFGGPDPDDAAKGMGVTVLFYAAVQIALNALLLPMWNAMLLVQFQDLRLRKSGSDLAARAAAA